MSRPRKPAVEATPIQVGDVQPDLPEQGVTTNTANTPTENTPTEEQQEGVLQDQSLEEFNEHVKSLVALFVDQKTSELQERVSDLELLVGQIIRPVVPTSSGVPEYGGTPYQANDAGVPWYGNPR